jgi:hypothetical protein
MAVFSMMALSGCATIPPESSVPPATLAALQQESLHLQNIIEQQQAQLSREQDENAERFEFALNTINETLEKFERKMLSLYETKPETVVITDEKCPPLPKGHTRDGKLLLGEVEWLWLDAAGRAFKARIDTGAKTSSISAEEITLFERDGKQWVRFFIGHTGVDDRTQLEAPLARHARVRQASAEGFERRPVVRLSVRFGYLKKSSDFVQSENTEFTLTDRSRMTYPVLLGRDFLKDIAVVDVARKYIQPKPRITDIP